MIKIIIKQSLVVKGLPPQIFEAVRADLTFDNPVYLSAMKSGRYIAQGTPKYIYMYESIGDSMIYLPKGYMNNLLHRIGNVPKEIKDLTVSPEISKPISMISTPRDYQELAIKDILEKRYGVLEASTGAGKTMVGICVTARRGVKTLVLVHSKELLEQWKEAFKKHTDIEKIGAIGDSKFDIQDVTIGIINSVAKNIDNIQGVFGQVIADECHRSMSPSWTSVLNSLNVKYQLGLSATPFRRDAYLTKGIYYLVGPKVHVVDKKHLTSIGAVLVPSVVRCPTYFNVNNDQAEYTEIISKLIEDRRRNFQIIENIIKDIAKYKEPVMVVSDRVSHCEILSAMLQQHPVIKSAMLTGAQSTKFRKTTVKLLSEGRFNVLLATTSLLGEGFDSPMLNALFLCTPIRFSGRLIQSCGRILRPSACQELPRIYDFRDNNIPVLQRSGWSRDSTYKKAGWL